MKSLYHFSKLRPDGALFERATKLDFDSFVASFEGRRPITSQVSVLSNSNGAIDIDFVGRFERLAEDFGKVSQKIGYRNYDGTLPHKNSSSKRGHNSEWISETRDIIAKMYEDDINAFGYEPD